MGITPTSQDPKSAWKVGNNQNQTMMGMSEHLKVY